MYSQRALITQRFYYFFSQKSPLWPWSSTPTKTPDFFAPFASRPPKEVRRPFPPSDRRDPRRGSCPLTKAVGVRLCHGGGGGGRSTRRAPPDDEARKRYLHWLTYYKFLRARAQRSFFLSSRRDGRRQCILCVVPKLNGRLLSILKSKQPNFLPRIAPQ